LAYKNPSSVTDLISNCGQVSNDRQQDGDDRHRVDQQLRPSRPEISPEESGQKNAANGDDQILNSEKHFGGKKSARLVDPRSDQSSKNDDGNAIKKILAVLIV
jgi:hypothetical protein